MSGRWFDCCKCREQIYLTDSQEDLLRKTQQEFFCRWGHKQHFPAGKTELQKAQDEVETMADRIEAANCPARFSGRAETMEMFA